MKAFLFSLSFACLAAIAMLNLTACDSQDELTAASATNDRVEIRNNPNSAVYPITAQPFGQSYAEWTEDWWQWVMSSDCATNPLLDETGANALIGQSGPVYFLVGNFGGVTERTVTIPADKALLFPIVNYICDYPCPEGFGFEPAPGQSLEEFLTECADSWIALAGGMSVTLDGIEMNNEEEYRAQTDLFYFTGNPDLPNCLDPCVTGTAQEAVSDGYWMMLKKLNPGTHTLHFTGGYPVYGFAVDVTYHLTVE